MMEKPVISVLQILVSLVCVVLVSCPGRLSGEEQIRRDFEVENARLREVGQKLTDSYNSSVCVEEARMFAVESDSEERVRELEERRSRGITLKSKNATLREVLDKLVEDEPAYTWRFNEQTRHFNIFPKEDAPLGWKIGNVEFKDKTLYQALLDEDVLGFKQHGIQYLPPFSSNGKWSSGTFSFKAADITAREALNRICVERARNQKPEREVRWTLYETGSDGSLRRRIISITPSVYGPSVPRSPRGPIRSDFSVEKSPISQVCWLLISTYQKPLCFEQAPIDFGKDNPKEKYLEYLEKARDGISLQTRNSSLEEVLDKLVQVQPFFKWNVDEATGRINIYPAGNAPFDWTIERIDFKDKTLTEIFKEQDLLGLKEHGIGYSDRSLSPTLRDVEVSLTAENITAREALNRICAQFDVPSRSCGPFWTSEVRGEWSFTVSGEIDHNVGRIEFAAYAIPPEPREGN